MIDEHFSDRPAIHVNRFSNHRDTSLMEQLIEALCSLESANISTLGGIETLNANALRAIGKGVAIDQVDSRRIQYLLSLGQNSTGIITREASEDRPLRI